MPLAHAAVGVSALADCVWLLPPWRDQGSWKRIHPYLRAWGAAPVQAPPVPLGGHRRHAVGATRLPHPPGPRL